MQEWLENKKKLMNSAHNERKSLIDERSIKTLKAKIF